VQNRNKMGALRQEVEMLRKQNQEYQVGSSLFALLLHLITVTCLGHLVTAASNVLNTLCGIMQ